MKLEWAEPSDERVDFSLNSSSESDLEWEPHEADRGEVLCLSGAPVNAADATGSHAQSLVMGALSPQSPYNPLAGAVGGGDDMDPVAASTGDPLRSNRGASPRQDPQPPPQSNPAAAEFTPVHGEFECPYQFGKRFVEHRVARGTMGFEKAVRAAVMALTVIPDEDAQPEHTASQRLEEDTQPEHTPEPNELLLTETGRSPGLQAARAETLEHCTQLMKRYVQEETDLAAGQPVDSPPCRKRPYSQQTRQEASSQQQQRQQQHQRLQQAVAMRSPTCSWTSFSPSVSLGTGEK